TAATTVLTICSAFVHQTGSVRRVRTLLVLAGCEAVARGRRRRPGARRHGRSDPDRAGAGAGRVARRARRAHRRGHGAHAALGDADMRPAVMPQRFHEALAASGSPADVAALEPQVEEWCARLADSPLPASLDHNDLHPWNVLDGPRYYDWGDAVIAHPFAAML